MKTLLYILIAMSTSLTFAQKNLVINGGFDQNTDGWWADNLNQNGVVKKVGAGSCMIVQYVGKEWKGADQKINIPKGTYAIAFSAYVKGDAIQGGESYGAGIVNAEFLNGADKQIVSENIAQVKGTADWKLYSKLILVPQGAKKIKMLIALQSTPGIVFFDEIKAVTVTEDEYNKIMQAEAIAQEAIPKPFVNASFEAGLQNWNGTGIVLTTDQKAGNAAVTITATVAEWTAIDQTADVPAGTKTIEISGWLKAKDIKQGKDPWNNGMFIIELTRDGKIKTSDDQLVGTVTGTTDWTYFKKNIPIPDGTKKFRIILALSACTGTLVADDIQIKMDNQ
ncbi:carbohydrate binding domain-containing protein [Flavobacterium restrictum]|uniref:CBM-cenC domain-containing protein n=1 Tax=Flavobacterium restrictum TaxID=2594428 RepID=A0A553E890_9FLAO|nr:carbohydrate binding domain-containing protein [Flavobacterium restrictum]TRX41284.1 hypothetical protein FNW21_04085 [Flavobacterium restrictum]